MIRGNVEVDCVVMHVAEAILASILVYHFTIQCDKLFAPYTCAVSQFSLDRSSSGRADAQRDLED